MRRGKNFLLHPFIAMTHNLGFLTIDKQEIEVVNMCCGADYFPFTYLLPIQVGASKVTHPQAHILCMLSAPFPRPSLRDGAMWLGLMVLRP